MIDQSNKWAIASMNERTISHKATASQVNQQLVSTHTHTLTYTHTWNNNQADNKQRNVE